MFTSKTSTITVGGLNLPLRGAEFVLDNAQLDFLNSNSLGLPLSIGERLSPSLGKMTVLGRSQFKSSGGHDIIIPEALDLVLGPGARLQLDPGVCLIVD
jgi:hypothetical protein